MEMVISDMKDTLDPSQYGNQKNLSIQHYLVRLLHRVVSSVDRNSKGEVNAVLCLGSKHTQDSATPWVYSHSLKMEYGPPSYQF